MELESDAPHKFSRHLIIHIPGMAFANNLHVGAFVSDVCTTAVDSQSGISSLQVAKVLTPLPPPLCADGRPVSVCCQNGNSCLVLLHPSVLRMM